LGARLAVDHQGPSLRTDELGLTEGKTLAFEWQKLRSHARWNDFHGVLSGRPGARWIVETHSLFGVVAEQILVSIEAEVEKEYCRRALAAVTEMPDAMRAGCAAHYSRSLRFFSEGQSNALVVGLHALTNLAARSLEFDQPLKPAELKKLRIKDVAAFAPGSVAKAAWIALEGGTLATLVSIAADRGAASVGLIASLQSIHSDPAITTLLELRNIHYHRWRGESPGVTGIDLSMKSASQLLSEGEPVTVCQELLPDYTGGATSLKQLERASLDALKATISHMDQFLGAWQALFSESFVAPG